jgi:hypothetical protein
MPSTNIDKIKDAVRSIVHVEINELKNGFKKDIIREVKSAINGEIKIQLAEIWDKMSEIAETKILVAKNDVAATLDRFIKKTENKLDYFEVLVKGQNTLTGRTDRLEEQRQTSSTDITRLQAQTNGRGQRLGDLEKRVNVMEDQPGKKALTAAGKRKSTIIKVVVGILIALGSVFITWFITWIVARVGG